MSVEAVDPVFQAAMVEMLKQTGRPEMVVGWYHSVSLSPLLVPTLVSHNQNIIITAPWIWLLVKFDRYQYPKFV